MAGAMRKMAVYLGLVEDDDRYDEYDEYDDGREDRRRDPQEREAAEAREPRGEARDVREAREVREVRDLPQERTRTIAAVRDEPVARRGAGATVAAMPHRVPAPAPEPVSALDRITTIHPRAYNDAKAIGETFREGTPVIMNLTDMDDADAKRLVDFAAGLIFGLHGGIERVTNKVFLLSPANVSVTAEDKARMAESGFFNQS
jgi:cell division inhibitor SepF